MQSKSGRTVRIRIIYGLIITSLMIITAYQPISNGAYSWGVTTVDANGGDPSIALDSKDYPHICYRTLETNEEIKYAQWNGSSWSIQIVDKLSRFSSSITLHLDRNDIPHICYYDITLNSVKYAKRTGANWNIQIINTSIFINPGITMDLDSTGDPHIIYGIQQDLIHTWWNGTAWNNETIESASGYPPGEPELKIDGNDHLHVIYCRNTGSYSQLIYAERTGLSWNMTNFFNYWFRDITYPSLDIDGSNVPHIVYGDYFYKTLIFRTWNGTAWASHNITTWNNYIGRPMVRIDGNNGQHVCYEADGVVYYAKYNLTKWEKEIVDKNGDPYSYGNPSFAIGINQSLHIAFPQYTFNAIHTMFINLMYANIIHRPSAPLNLSATSGNKEIRIFWSAPTNPGSFPITNYCIYRSTSAGNETWLKNVGNVTNFTDEAVINGQTYYYMISAINSVGEGPKSAEANATPFTVPTAPSFNGTTVVPGAIRLKWLPPVDSGGFEILHYKIYRDDFVRTYANVASSILWFNDTFVTEWTNYTYWISATNSAGESNRSSPVVYRSADATKPFAEAGVNQTMPIGTTVTFEGSGSYDNIAITNYTWTFSYNGSTVSLYGGNPNFKFEASGNYTVMLNVTDVQGNWNTDFVAINIYEFEVIIDPAPGYIWIIIISAIMAIALSLIGAIYVIRQRKKGKKA